MDQDRKKVIIREIEYWRKSKLLPEHYCDFLRNLYMEDPAVSEKTRIKEKSKINNFSKWMGLLLIIVFVAIISLIVIHFNAFSSALQITLSGFFTAGFYGLGFWRRRVQLLQGIALVGLASILLLLLGEYWMHLHAFGAWSAVGYVAFCGAAWLILGFTFRIGLLHASGWAALALFYSYWINQSFQPAHWALLQILWLPFAFLLAWLGWRWRRQAFSTAAIFFAVSAVFWVAPEIYDMVMTEGAVLSRSSLTGKLVITAIGAFYLRKKSTERIAK